MCIRDSGQQLLGDLGGQLGGRGGDVRVEGGEHVVGGVVRLGGRGGGARPVVVPDHGGAVVDEPQAVVPDQQVGVAPGAVDIVDQRVEPDHTAGLHGVDLEGERVETEGTGQEVHAEVEPAAGLEERLHLGVGLAAADDRVQLDPGQLRHAQPQPAAELPADHLGDQRLAALAGAGEFHDIGPEIVRLDDAGERAALTQGRDVAGRRDFGEHRPRLLGGSRGR